jgi:hypothetical protein
MAQAISQAPQATIEQLLLEVSAGVSLDEAAGVLGIPASTALHIMQQHAMETRVLNLVQVWTDAQFKMFAETKSASAVEGASNVVDLASRFRLR